MPGPTLPLFRCSKDCLYVETVLGGTVLSNASHFIQDGVLRRELILLLVRNDAKITVCGGDVAQALLPAGSRLWTPDVARNFGWPGEIR